jgi:hypothetical protein
MDRAPVASRTTDQQDLRDQAVVLTHVLALHPAHLSVAELVREVTAGAVGFEPGDRYERAIHDLAAVGLFHVRTGLVTPTRAALVFNSLDRD